MNEHTFLLSMRLSRAEFYDLIDKFLRLLDDLNEAQRVVVINSLPRLWDAARSFGPDVDPEDLFALMWRRGGGPEGSFLGTRGWGFAQPPSDPPPGNIPTDHD
jgi:hypothetical protein